MIWKLMVWGLFLSLMIKSADGQMHRLQGSAISPQGKGVEETKKSDKGRGLRGLSESMHGMEVRDRRDIDQIVPSVEMALGFEPNESLEFHREMPGQLHYRRVINGIPTDNIIRFLVSEEQRTLRRILGTRSIPTRIMDPSEAMEKDAAIQKAADHVNSLIEKEPRLSQIYDMGTEPRATLHYRPAADLSGGTYYALVWYVMFPVSSEVAAQTHLDEVGWRVGHDGEVSSTEFSAHLGVRVCDGAGAFAITTVPCVHPWPSPLVIDQQGVCQGGYDCSGQFNKYQWPWDLAHEIHDMWEDLLSTGCCDVGANGPSGSIAFKVVPNNSIPGVARYRVNHSEGDVTTHVVEVEADFAINGKVIAHEMGHALHLRHSAGTFLASLEGTTSLERAEHHAVREYVGDVMSVVFANYNGATQSPKFEDNISQIDWVAASGQDLSSQLNHSQIQSFQPDHYRNARVGGHAFYELANQIGLEAAAYIFLNSIEHIELVEDEFRTSFQKVREAMLARIAHRFGFRA